MEREKSLDQMNWGELYTIFDEYCGKRFDEYSRKRVKTGPCRGCPCKKMETCRKLIRDITNKDLIEAIKAIEGIKE